MPPFSSISISLRPFHSRTAFPGSLHPPFLVTRVVRLALQVLHLTADTLSSSAFNCWLARHYSRLWIRCPSSEHRRDLNPPDSCAAQRTLRRPDFSPSVSRPYGTALRWTLPLFLARSPTDEIAPSFLYPLRPLPMPLFPASTVLERFPSFDSSRPPRVSSLPLESVPPALTMILETVARIWLRHSCAGSPSRLPADQI